MSYYDLPDHPIVQNMERTGYPDGKEPHYPICPVCGEETDMLYKTINDEIIGCDNCIRSVDAWNKSSDI